MKKKPGVELTEERRTNFSEFVRRSPSHMAARQARKKEKGFAVAPILYLLMMAGVAAGVLFSGYSQILRTNLNVTNATSAKGDLSGGETTLAATAVFSDDETIFCPPRGTGASAECASAPQKMVAFASADSDKLPSSYTTASSSGSPLEVGVFAAGAGVKQLDPWGRYYVYCRWENTRASADSPAMAVISAGANGTIETGCGASGPSGDDQMVTTTVGEAINRAAVWQQSSDSTQASFGVDGTGVTVTADGIISAAGLILTGTATIDTLNLGSPLPVTVGGTGAEDASDARSNLGAGSVGDSLFTSTTASGARSILGATTAGDYLFAGTSYDDTIASSVRYDLLGVGTVGNSLFVSETATEALSALDATTMGVYLLTSSAYDSTTASSVRTTLLGSSSIGDSVFTASTVDTALTALGGSDVGKALFQSTSAATARTTLGAGAEGSLLFTATTQADAWDILGLTGTLIPTLDIDTSGEAGSVDAANITGGAVPIVHGGTSATTASGALDNLFTGDSAPAVTINSSRIADDSITSDKLTDVVSSGTYNVVQVDDAGRVVGGTYTDVSADQITDEAGDSIWATATGGGYLYFMTASSVWMTLDPSGYLGLNISDPGERLHVNEGNIRISGAAETLRELQFHTGTDSERWGVGVDATAESGSDAGSDFVITRTLDDTSESTAMKIDRATGNVTFSGTVSATGGFSGTVSGSSNLGSSLTATSPHEEDDLTTGFYTPTAGHIGVASGGSEIVRFTSTGSVGIGTSSPNVTLDVGSATDAVQLPSGTAAQRPTGVAGMIRYNSEDDAFEGYTSGSGWGNVAGPTTSVETAGQTITDGWPDAIVCVSDSTTDRKVLYPYRVPTDGGEYSYRTTYDNDYIVFASNGDYDRQNGLGAFNCITSTMSIADLVSNGQAFNTVNSSTSDAIAMDDGTAGAPGLYFGSDTNTGLYRPGADQLAVAVGGVERARFGSAGAGLDLSLSTGTAYSSIIVPADTTANRPTTTAQGMIRFNTTDSAFEGYDGSAWASLGGASSEDLSSNILLGASAAATNPHEDGDVTTGLYTPTTGHIGTAIAGSEVMRVTATGVGVLNSSPAEALDVTGNAQVSGTAAIGTTIYDGATLTLSQAVEDASATTNYLQRNIGTLSGTLTGAHSDVGEYVSLTNTSDRDGYSNKIYGEQTEVTSSGDAYYIYGSDVALSSSGSSTSLLAGQLTLTNDSSSQAIAAQNTTTTNTGSTTFLFGQNNNIINSGTASYLWGLKNNISNSGTATAFYGTQSFITNTGTADTGYGSLVNVLNQTGGSLETSYLYYGIASDTPGTITDNWGLYLEGEDKNYLSGMLGVQTKTPAVAIDASGATDAIALPVGAESDRPTGAVGMLRYNSDDGAFEGYTGSGWGALGEVGSEDLSSNILLGASAAATNPHEDGDATTGLYTPTTGHIGTAIAGSEVVRVTATGVGVLNSSPTQALDVTGNAQVSGRLSLGTAGFDATRIFSIESEVEDSDLYLQYFAGESTGTMTDDRNLYGSVTTLNNSADSNGYKKNVYGQHIVAQADGDVRFLKGQEIMPLNMGNADFVMGGSYGVGNYGEVEKSYVHNATLMNLTGTITTSYLYYGTAINTGEITNNWGLYLTGVDKNYLSGMLGIQTAAPAVALDVSGATDAIALPVGAESDRPTGAVGMLRYNSDDGEFEGYTGSGWGAIGGASASDLSSGVLLGSSAAVTNPHENGDVTTGLYTPTTSHIGTAIAGSEIMRVTATGVGILNSSPTEALDVTGNAQISGNVAIGGDVNDNRLLFIRGTAPDASIAYGSMLSYFVSDAPSQARTSMAGLSQLTNYVDGSTYSNDVVGFQGQATNQVGGTLNTAQGLRGGIVNANTSGVGIGSAYGVNAFVTNTSTGTVTTAYGVNSAVTNPSTGTLTTGYLYGGYFSGTIGTAYGLFLTGEDYNYLSGNLGIGVTTPTVAIDASGMTDAIRLPRGTTAQRPSSSSTGMIRYNTTSGAFEGYSSTGWGSLGDGGSSGGESLFGTSAAATNPHEDGDVTTGFYTPTAGHIGIATGGSEVVRITATGSVGIGTSSPNVTLDVGSATDAVHLPSGTAAQRPTGVAGMIRYNSDDDAFEGYTTASGWAEVQTTTTSVATNGQTLFNGWPDAIVCNRPAYGSAYVLYADAMPGTHGYYVYRYLQDPTSSNDFYIQYSSTGEYYTHNNMSEYDCVTDTMSISDLVSAGQAFNLVNSSTSNAIAMDDGTAGAPGLYFGADTDTGLYRPGDNQLAVAVGGVERARFGAAGSALDMSLATGTAYSSVVLPADTTANRPTTVTQGMLRFNTTESEFEGYNGSSWSSISGVTSDALADSVLLGTSAAATNPHEDGDVTTGFYTPSTGSIGVAVSGSEVVRISATGSVGIGTSTPNVTLDVGGATDAVALPAGTTAQRPTTEATGMVRYNSTAGAFEGYTSSGWTSFSTTNTGASTNGQTMIDGWPDAIVCKYNSDDAHIVLIPNNMPDSTDYYNYHFTSNTSLGLRFNADGSFYTHYSMSGYDCGSDSMSISDLVANGQAFYFVNSSTSNAIAMDDGTAGAPGQYFGNDDDTGFYRPGLDQLAIAVGGVERARFGTDGAGLDLSLSTGTAYSSVILPADTTANRPTTTAQGMLRFNTTDNVFEGYNGSSWSNLSSATGVTTAGQTVDEGFPDAIVCSASTDIVLSLNQFHSGGTATYYYMTSYYLTYAADGSYSTGSGLSGYDCYDDAMSISELVSAGKAFNYVNSSTSNAIAMDDGTAGAPGSYFGADEDTGLYRPGDNQLAIAVGGVERARFGTDGAGLDLSLSTGTAYSSVILPADTTDNRPTTTAQGMLRFNTTTSAFEGYNGSAWSNLSTGTGIETAGQTVVEGWPDAILCQNGSYKFILSAAMMTTTTDLYMYVWSSAAKDFIMYFDSDGSFNSYSNLAGYDCADNSMSISDLVSAGQAFNYVNSSTSDAIAMDDGTAGAPGSYFGSDTNTGLYRPGADQLAIAVGGVERARFGTDGAGLDLSLSTGTAYSSVILPADTTANRPTTTAQGMLRFNTTTAAFEGYNGSAWSNLSTGTGVTTAGQTMIDGWPDAIVCTYGDYVDILTADQMPNSSGTYLYMWSTGGAAYGIYFNSDGSFSSNNNLANYDCTVDEMSISELVAAGQAFNYVNSSTSNAIAMDDGTAGAPGSYFGSDTNTGLYRPGADQLAIAVGGVERARFGTDGAGLDLSLSTGTAYSSVILPADTTANRPTTTAQGMLRFNTTDNVFEGYNGSAWSNLSTGTTVSTEGQTVVDGWPDSIFCQNGTYSVVLKAQSFPGGNGYSYKDQGASLALFFTSDGEYASNTSLSDYDCVTDAASISTLVSSGRAFNMVNSSTSDAIAMDDGTAGAPGSYFGADTNTGLYRPGADQLAIAVGGVERARFGTDGAGLDLSLSTGTAYSSVILPADTTANRPTTTAQGMLRFNTTDNVFEGYNGSAWSSLSSATSVITAGQSVVNGWPDAIVCKSGELVRVVRLEQAPNATGHLYRLLAESNYIYFSDDGSYLSQSGFGGFDCITDTMSISDLVAAGQAFNFVNSSTSNAIAMDDGTAGAPGSYFGADTDTGFYRVGSNQLGIALGGTLRAAFGSNGAALDMSNASGSSYSSVILPSDTTANRPSTGVIGMVRYNTDDALFEGYTASGWDRIGNVETADLADSVLLGASAAATNPHEDGDVTTGIYTPTAGHIGIASGGSELVRISATGGVGIGTSSPNVTLDVGSATDAIALPVGTSAERPATEATGMIRYNSDNNMFEGYTSSGWSELQSSTTGVNTVGQTMVSGWPDAIICSDGTNLEVMRLSFAPLSTYYYYESQYNYRILYNADGTYYTHANSAAFDCVTDAMTISELAAAGRTFNLVNSSTSDAIAMDDGTAGAPGLYFGAEDTTGLYRPEDGAIGFATSGVEKMRLSSDGTLGINTNEVAVTNASTMAPRVVVNGEGVNGALQVVRHTSPGGGGAQLIMSTTRGTSPEDYTTLQDGDGIGMLSFNGTDGSQYVVAAGITAIASGTVSTGTLPTDLVFGVNDGSVVNGIPEVMRLTSTGALGLGTSSPNVTLDVGSATDAIALPVGATTDRPTTESEGMLRYNSTTSSFEGYTSLGWSVIGSTTTSVDTASQSVVAGWPDAIVCTYGSYSAILTLEAGPYSNSYYYYRAQTVGYVAFNSDGSYYTQSGLGNYDCYTSTMTISQLVAAGQAFNFVNSTTSSALAMDDGTAGAPGQYFGADNDTGFYRPGSNQLGIALGGTLRAAFGSNEAALDFSNAGSSYSSVILPSDTTANRPSTGVVGMVRYNTDDALFEGYTASGWDRIGNVETADLSDSVLLGASAAATNPHENGDATTGIYTPTAGHIGIASGGSELVRISATGGVGIGTSSPNVTLDVGSATDAIALPVGTEAQRPTTEAVGMLRYNSDDNVFEGYLSSGWAELPISPTGVTTAGQTAVSGWPDTIVCNYGEYRQIMRPVFFPNTNGYYYYKSQYNYHLIFNSDGSYYSHSSMGSYDCVTGTMSISDLVSAGQAFNMVNSATSDAIAMDDGTAGAPGLYFGAEDTTGLYRPEDGSLGIALSGTEKARFSTGDQLFHVNQTSTDESKIGVYVTLAHDGTNTGSRTNAGVYSVVSNSADNDGNTDWNYGAAGVYKHEVGASGNGAGSYGLAVNNDTSTSSTSSIFGSYNYASNQSTGTVNSFFGSSSTLSNSSTGTITQAFGARAEAVNNSSGTITSAYGIQGYVRNDEGTISSAYGNNAIVDQSSSGSIGNVNAYRAQITQTAGSIDTGYLYYGRYDGTVGTKWGIYLTGEDTNYLSGKLGVQTADPNVAIDASGATDAISIPVGALAERPATAVTGMLRYNTDSDEFEGYTSRGWGVIESSTTGMSTDGTTVITGWPDMIQCKYGSYSAVLTLEAMPYTNGYYYYRAQTIGYLIFNSDGSYYSQSGLGNYDCVTGTMTISDLYDAGQAFNLVTSDTDMSDDYDSEIVLGASAAATNPHEDGDATTGFYTPDSGAVAFATSGSEVFRITATGSVGIGTSSPGASLDLSSNSDALAVPVGAITDRPTTPVFGMIRYNSDAGVFEGYSTSGWGSLAAEEAAGDTGAGEGETMITDWPDAIVCESTSPVSTMILYGTFMPNSSDSLYYYKSQYNFYLIYNSDGTYYAQSNLGSTYDCVGDTMSISDLETAGQTFNLVGGVTADDLATNILLGASVAATNPHADGDTTTGFYSPSAGAIGMVSAGTETLRMTATGSFGIGTTDPAYALEVSGVVAGSVNFVNTSDARLKKDVTPIEYGLDTLMQLKPIGFNWKDQSEDWAKGHQLGFIAQEVEPLIPEVVTTANDLIGTKSIAYSEIVPVTVKAIQELKVANDNQRQQIAALVEENKNLKAQIKALADGKALPEEGEDDQIAQLVLVGGILFGVTFIGLGACLVLLLRRNRKAA